jgi:hypothetical protein
MMKVEVKANEYSVCRRLKPHFQAPEPTFSIPDDIQHTISFIMALLQTAVEST